MQEEIDIYIGWDPRELNTVDKCIKSLRRTSSIPLNIHLLRDIDMRKKGFYWRPYRVDRNGQHWDDRDGVPFSTEFSYIRYLTPIIHKNKKSKWFLFCDPDMMFRRDIRKLIEYANNSSISFKSIKGKVETEPAVMVVKHDHNTKDGMKMGGVIQTSYSRKNWSSFMLFNIDHIKVIDLTPYQINMQSKDYLHKMCWVDDRLIGSLPEEWNWLEGHSPVDIDPAVVHFTRGTPEMIGSDFKILYSDEWMNL